ncbi:hypothetical protein ACLESD_17620 [Pyxidicoccus sp. 3LFB2]
MRQQPPKSFTPRRLWRWVTRLAVLFGILGGATQVAAFVEERQHHQVPPSCAAEQSQGVSSMEAPEACTTPPADG